MVFLFILFVYFSFFRVILEKEEYFEGFLSFRRFRIFMLEGVELYFIFNDRFRILKFGGKGEVVVIFDFIIVFIFS